MHKRGECCCGKVVPARQQDPALLPIPIGRFPGAPTSGGVKGGIVAADEDSHGRCVLALFPRIWWAGATERTASRARLVRFMSTNHEEQAMSQVSEVLMVDDNMADVFLASEALRMNSAYCNISNVGDGEEALAYLRHEGRFAGSACPNVVILDLRLPKKSGEAVLAELRADPNLRKIPVVIFSSSRSNQDIVRSYELGANCYLSKGNLPEFISTVQLIGTFFGGHDNISQGEQWNDQKRAYC
jgi:chemotaxis family two-component system response regulator Rcp1